MPSVSGQRHLHKGSEAEKLFSCLRQIYVEGFRETSLWPDSSVGCLALWAGHLLKQRDLWDQGTQGLAGFNRLINLVHSAATQPETTA